MSLLVRIPLLLAFATPAWAERDLMSDTWVATDGLGRKLPIGGEVRTPRADRFVGIFYVGWHGAHGYDELRNPTDADQGVMPKEPGRKYRSPYDVSKILAENPQNPQWGTENAFHHACEPELGYYLSDDEYVIRKHAHMLSNAGVDVIFLDITNGVVYRKIYLNLFRIYHELRKSGERTPQIAFMAHSGHWGTVPAIYETYYKANLYPDLWFRWQGKPLLLSPTEGLSEEIKNFFTIRYTWAWSTSPFFGDGRDKWTFFDNHPQKAGWHESPNKPEQISVTTAQHAHTNIGRSFHNGKQPPPAEQRPADGLCFAEQWRQAIKVNPEFVFLVDWNEWTASRFVFKGKNDTWPIFLGQPMKPGDSWFVDQYTQEYSRAIEPMKGGHGDAYYYQMIANIRQYKGARSIPLAVSSKNIRIDGRFDDWRDVTPEYRDAAGDTFHRKHPGWGRIETYSDATGRNDLVTMKATDDTEHVFFFASTREQLTPWSDANWMLLFIDADCSTVTGWHGYDFVVNRRIQDGKAGSVDRWDGGTWQPAGSATMAYAGNQLELMIPCAIMSMRDRGQLQFDFHWSDNMQSLDAIEEFALHGDNAPDRRFNYRYLRPSAATSKAE